MKKDKMRLNCKKGDKKITVIFNARSYTSKFQLILCFNIDLKEFKDSFILKVLFCFTLRTCGFSILLCIHI